MPSRIALTVDGAPFAAGIGPDGVTVDRARPPWRITPLFDGRFLVEGPDGPIEAIAVLTGNIVWIAIGDDVFECRLGAAGRAARRARDADALSAPMPATVAHVAVTVGQTVSAGDVLVSLEAMKMELAIRAPRDGVVTAVNCRAGDMVQPGAPLVDL
jgi:pyruvate carboxylase